MVCRASFTLKGLDEYLEKIAQAGLDVDQAAAHAVVAGGDVLVTGMVKRAPEKTGNLKRHLQRTKPVLEGNVTFILVGVLDGEYLPDAKLATYANVQEYGSAHTPAHPYIRPTFDEDKSKMRAAERAALQADGIL